MKDFRTFLQDYEKAYPDMVVHVRQEVSARWQLSAIALKAQKELAEAPLLIFDRLCAADGRTSPVPVVANLFASRSRMAFAVGSSFERVPQDMFERRSARLKPVTVARGDAPVKQVVKTGDAVDLLAIPAIVHAAWDPGPYVSAGFLTTYDPDTGIDNCGLQRGWLYSQRELRIFPGSASHNAWNIKKIEDSGKDARVAYWVGHHPAAYLGAEVKLGYPDSHWSATGGLLGEPLRLVASETLGDDFLVPADAEFVIEGIVPRGKRKPEGPFGEFTRYFGGQRLNPYMEVTAITHRENPYWVTIVTGYADDGIGGLRREGYVFDLLKRVVPQVKNIYRPPSNPTYIYIQLKKTQDWQPRAIIMAALSAPEAIKYVFVFDEDINIFDETEVHWAIGSQSDWAKDLIVIPELQTSNLDPTSVRQGIGTRAGIDCTKPAPPGVYEQKSFIPADVMDKVVLEEFVPRPASAAGRQGKKEAR